MIRSLAFFFLLIITVTLVAAQPPSEYEVTTQGLSVKVPIQDTIRIHDDYYLNVYVYNSSGYPLSSGVNCYLSLYNESGDLIFRISEDDPTDLFNYQFKIEGGNFSKIEEYPFLLQCNNTREGGFRSSYLDVTPHGRPHPPGNVRIFFIITFMIMIFAATGLMIKSIGLVVQLNVDIMDVAYNFGLYFVLLAFYGLTIQYMGNQMIENILSIGVRVMAVTHIIVPITAFAISLLFKPFAKGAGMKDG